MGDAVFTRNALDSPPAIEQRYPYGKPRFPNLDPRAYFDDQARANYSQEPLLDKFRETAPWALLGLGRSPAPRPQPMQPQLIQREAKQAGDDSLGQHVYEALLGRVRKPGEAVAAQGSGGRWTNPVAWLVAGLGGYGGYKVGETVFGDPFEHWNELKKMSTPGTPEYEAEQNRVAKIHEDSRQWRINQKQNSLEENELYGPRPTLWNGGSLGESLRRAQWFGLSGASPTNPLPWANGIPYPPDPNKP